MVSRRTLLAVGGWSILVALAGCGRADDAAIPSTAALAPATTAVAAPASTPPTITAITEPAVATTPADRPDEPLLVDWIGGSDVAWEGVSLPDGFARRVPDLAGRPVHVRTHIRQAVMAPGVQELLGEVLARGTDAVVVSINPVWLHWDEVSCGEIADQHARYRCLLSPADAALSAQRAAELRSLVDAIADAGVPAYVYIQPHSTESLADPQLAELLTAAESAIASLDPQRPDVKFVGRIFTRDLPPLREGTDFIDMVHPTATGAEPLSDWLAFDITRFWTEIGLAG